MTDRDVYEARFSDDDALRKEALWRELVKWLSTYIQGPVLDVACDRGHFIRNVTADERWASDIRDVSAHLDGVQFVQASGLKLGHVLPAEHFRTVFMSNYLEHLRTGDEVVDQLKVAHGLLRPDGRLIVLQPNIRYAGAAYWDFIDHHVALTERSLAEAADLAGFTTERLIPRFLPYTTKSGLPQSAALVRLYLRIPLAWRFLGAQILYIGRPS
jgi:SAM-dependent methyltransferase